MSLYRLDRMFSPRSIVVVGASPRATSLGRAILGNLRRSGFSGAIHVVNPKHATIDGVETVSSIDRLPLVPDLAIVTAPAGEIPSIVDGLARKGTVGAVIVSGKLGHGPGSLAEQAERAARPFGMRLIGPNCLGILNPRSRLNASFAAEMPPAGNLALVSQSGAIVAALVSWASHRGIGFSGIASIGDQIEVDVADLLDHFACDPATKSILLYVEGIKDARKFMSAARAAARVKPVIVVKSGRFAESAKAATTHTGALAGSDGVYDAAFRRAGLVRVDDLRELFDCAETLSRVPKANGHRLGILTNGGGLGVLAMDRLISLAGTPAELSVDTFAKLDACLPAAWSKGNPIDIIGDADEKRYAQSLEVLLDDALVDAVLVVNVATAIATPLEAAEAVAQRVALHRKTHPAKPVLAAWVGNEADDAIAGIFNDAGIPNYPTGDDAVRGFMHLVRYQEAIGTLMKVPAILLRDFECDLQSARAVIVNAIGEGRSLLDPIEASAILKAFHIPGVETVAAANAEQAAVEAERMLRSNKAVVVKILSHDISHKSDVDGVRVGLSTPQDVRAAVESVIANARRLRPDAKIRGVIVQPMIEKEHARELIAGLSDDETFGPVILFGQGGTAVEVIQDRALALPPLDLTLAAELVSRPRVSKILKGYRNVPAVKAGEVELTLVKLSMLSAACPEITGLDVNPLLADADGVLALDCRISLKPLPTNASARGNRRFAIRPYPVEWERHLDLNGLSVNVRPVRPEDAPLFNPFLSRVTAQDLRLRFFAPIKELGAAFIARLTQLDYARAMAFIAFDEKTGDMLGVVRLHADAQYRTAEYAILVRSDLKGRGLGWRLMELLIDYAKSEKFEEIKGQVLRENTTMLRMCEELSFRSVADGPDIYQVSLTLRGL